MYPVWCLSETRGGSIATRLAQVCHTFWILSFLFPFPFLFHSRCHFHSPDSFTRGTTQAYIHASICSARAARGLATQEYHRTVVSSLVQNFDFHCRHPFSLLFPFSFRFHSHVSVFSSCRIMRQSF